ncbi:TPA: hypothetical protein DEO28_01345 [Candidatus Dependentiae bacterium]|nr:MAG: B-glycosidase, glycoside hydrolase family 3 protein [candidate division TM6 bacterium GW2011_GWE2_31_21]KKP53719.1 MAG: B-glycosidase, glycoside hydrolase family 3 protein [candidate division TM6 bacterium GW2011_GWF2_33_332]HBS48529.1 hypothetical protein [Candidatus Dependentiae bacterium]HBZ73144.1 hypothetical protein [Candidatus Dependentiae bacterium]
MKKFIWIFSFLVISLIVYNRFFYIDTQSPQIILQTMTLREKIGQLFMTSAISYPAENPFDKVTIERLIKEYNIGGIMFFSGTPVSQIKISNYYQSISKIPLLYAQDCEWGPSMRLINVIKFPKNFTLGALRDNSLIYKMGMEIGRQCKLLGVKLNFAPDVDVNNNPQNPVIGIRSFGEDPIVVVAKAYEYIQGMLQYGVMACIKHFPGHGNVVLDSHLDLPTVFSSYNEIQNMELYTFRELFKKNVFSVMTAHLHIPALDSNSNLPTSLSPLIVTDLLQNQMGFKGLIITDGLRMGGIRKTFNAGETAVRAFLAGNDILLFCDLLNRFGEPPHLDENIADIKQGVDAIEVAVKNGTIAESEIDRRVLKILSAKQSIGLFKNRFVDENIRPEEFYSQGAMKLKQDIFDNAVTLVKNENQMLPFIAAKDNLVAFISLGLKPGSESILFKNLNEKMVLSDVRNSDTVIVALYGLNNIFTDNFGVREEVSKFIESLHRENKKVILILFGIPYALKFFGKEDAILVAYEQEVEAEIAAAKVIFGEIAPKGKLPVTASKEFGMGIGLSF